MDFGRLQDLREDNDLTQKELGNILGCSNHAISVWETEKEIIPLRKLNMYANYFHVSLDYLVKLSNDKTTNNILELDKVLIGHRIETLRKQHKITQRELARILNTTNSTIWAYEKGKTLILTAFAYQICKYFNVSMDYLCGREKKSISVVKN